MSDGDLDLHTGLLYAFASGGLVALALTTTFDAAWVYPLFIAVFWVALVSDYTARKSLVFNRDRGGDAE